MHPDDFLEEFGAGSMKYNAAIFDWAGTMVDFGSFAPMGAFVEVFAEFGMEISVEQAREPMGMAKRDHIAAILNMPDVSRRYKETYGHLPDNAAIDRIYDIFVPLNEKVAGRHAGLVPGARDTVEWLRKRGMKVGSTTGYTRSIMEHVLPVAADQGYEPDNLVCSDEVKNGRPAADAMIKCFSDLGIDDPASVIKVDDTEPGIGEGVSAGCLTVGVMLSGNYAGKHPKEIAEMDEAELDEVRKLAGARLQEAGADHLIDTVAELPSLIERLEMEASVSSA